MTGPKWSVVSVEPQDNYELLVRFNDGQQKLYDVKPLLKYPIYFPLKNERLFQQAKAEYGTVVWNDDVDIAPEILYERGIPVG